MESGEKIIGERIEHATSGKKAKAYRRILRRLPAGTGAQVVLYGQIPEGGARDSEHVQIVLADGQSIAVRAANIDGAVYEEEIPEPTPAAAQERPGRGGRKQAEDPAEPPQQV